MNECSPGNKIKGLRAVEGCQGYGEDISELKFDLRIRLTADEVSGPGQQAGQQRGLQAEDLKDRVAASACTHMALKKANFCIMICDLFFRIPSIPLSASSLNASLG